uniref:Oxoglutarate (alpha-ketoglutarate) receptor 1a, tandem duplicate 2 n=2 Tax=Echeneis naucrates TaxID=173247 RepID=A0A665WB00_ECHNA
MDTSGSNGEDPISKCVVQLMKRYYLPVFYTIIFIVALVGNVTSIAIYLTKLRPWKSSSIIMVNLALTDLLYVLSMPFLVHYYSIGESWLLSNFMCRYIRFSFHFHLYGSILFLTCLAVFRFAVVLKPLIAAQVEKRFWGILACSAVWVIVAAQTVPMLWLISSEESQNKTVCMDFASTKCIDQLYWYSWLLTTVGFLLPLVVVFLCYIGIRKQLAEGPYESTPSRVRARRVTVLILVVFVVCFLPYHTLRVLRIHTRRQNTPASVHNIVDAAYIISRPLAGLNTVSNLALYTLSGDKFRRAFRNTFHWARCLDKARSLLGIAPTNTGGTDMPDV